MTTLASPQPACASTPALPSWQRFPGLALALAAALAAFFALPSVHENPRMVGALAAAVGLLVVWSAVLSIGASLWGQRFRVAFVAPARVHYIQGSVQLAIYAYWGWYHRDVYAHMPMVLAQLIFYFAFDGLLSWSRGREWRFGCGPLPIILSTNVFLWFKPDWYVFQFLLIASAALGKEFIRWNRDGRRVHIFNPSAFGLVLFAIVLLATDTTKYTWAGRIADSFNRPTHIYLVIFLLGLVVQYFFSVTLMTLSAAATIAALTYAYTQITGTYHFVTSNIPAPVFLGLHLLMTDPATSPRSNVGRVIFGCMYGVLTFIAYGILSYFDAYTVYDKLLPIPVLNLCVRWIDRVAASRPLAFLRRIDQAFQPRRLNLTAMSAWGVLFAVMLSTGFVEAPHEGSTYAFWKKALDEGRPGAAKGLVNTLLFEGRNDNAAALNELGVIHAQGTIVERDNAKALRYFGMACKLGDVAASANIAKLFLDAPGAREGVIVLLAFDQIERACEAAGTRDAAQLSLHYLLGRAYEEGHGRPLDLQKARMHYERGCAGGDSLGCNGVARIDGASPAPRAPAK